MQDAEQGVPALTPESRIVIVGAGVAGIRTAFGLREAGFEGAILLLNEEAHAPYDRPPLSKAVLTGGADIDSIALARPHDLDAARIEIRNGIGCVGIDRAARRAMCAGGDAVTYDRLVLATGSALRTLPGFEPGKLGVHYLRTLDDALHLREELPGAGCVLVIGAGVIGLEAAAACVKGGRRVVVIDPAQRVMARAAAPGLSAFLEAQHRAEGVELLLGTTVDTASHVGDGWHVRLSDGTDLRPDLVIVGIGVMPRTELAQAAGMAVTPAGIAVDGSGRTNDPAIYAAGEVSFGFNERLGRHDRQETWAHAVAHGEHVARAIMGQEDGYGAHCSYWTDQFDVAVQVFGDCAGTRDVVRGEGTQFLIFHLLEREVVGVTSVNAARLLRQARKLVGRRVINPESLGDETADLASLFEA